MSNNQTKRDDCYFCGGGEGVLETHHIVPRRFGGSDEAENLVDLCPTCHQKLERLYDRRFYEEVEAGLGDDDLGEYLGACGFGNCTAEAEHTFEHAGVSTSVCDDHKVCSLDGCHIRTVTARPMNGDLALLCEDHVTCHAEGCQNDDTEIYRATQDRINTFYRPYCSEHGSEASILGEQFHRRWDDE